VGSESGGEAGCSEKVKPGQRRYDDVVAGVGEPVRHRNHLREGAGPAVCQEQRKPARVLRPDVQEVHPPALDGGDPLRLGVESLLLSAPIEAVPPMVDKSVHRRVVRARRPGRLGPPPWPPSPAQPHAKIIEVIVSEGDPEIGDLDPAHVDAPFTSVSRCPRASSKTIAFSRDSASSPIADRSRLGAEPLIRPPARAGRLKARSLTTYIFATISPRWSAGAFSQSHPRTDRSPPISAAFLYWTSAQEE
jgi:hypothetical protein